MNKTEAARQRGIEQCARWLEKNVGRLDQGGMTEVVSEMRAKLAHTPFYSRRQRGMTSASPSRPVYGWSVRCSCGWEHKTNETKRYVQEEHADHVRIALTEA